MRVLQIAGHAAMLDAARVLTVNLTIMAPIVSNGLVVVPRPLMASAAYACRMGMSADFVGISTNTAGYKDYSLALIRCVRRSADKNLLERPPKITACAGGKHDCESLKKLYRLSTETAIHL